MNRKIFLWNNWIVVVLFLISLFTDLTNQMMVVLVGVLLAIKAMQAVLYLFTLALKKYRIIMILLIILIVVSGIFVPVASLLIKGTLLVILGLEIIVHFIDAFLQYRQGQKTWMINTLFGALFICFLVYALFSWQSAVVVNILFFSISLSSLFYLISYYLKGEFSGNFTLLNMNAALYRDAFIPKGEFLKFANATAETLPKLVADNQFATKELPEKHLTIYLHAWKPTLDMMGHCDMSYQGNVYSFSNYDVERMKFGGNVSIGTIAITPIKQYLNFCTDVEEKLVYGYTVELTEAEASKMDHFIEQLYQNSKVWQPQNLENNKAAKLIIEKTDCEIREVIQGAFQNYFVLGANCVKLIDVMLNHIGIKTNASRALLTPGEYFKIFSKKHNDKIVLKRIYWKGVNHEEVI